FLPAAREGLHAPAGGHLRSFRRLSPTPVVEALLGSVVAVGQSVPAHPARPPHKFPSATPGNLIIRYARRMRVMTATEASRKFSDLLDAIERGETVTIT